MKIAGKLMLGMIAGAMAVASLTSCTTASSAADDGKTFTIWASGSDNVKVQFEQQVAKFNEIQDEYEAELQFITSGTGAESLSSRLIAAYQSGQTNTDYDLVESSDSEVINYLNQCGEDFFVEVDTASMENYSNLQYQPSVGQEYYIPYRGTTVLLAYNSDTVPNPPTTAEELYQWIQDNPGRFAYNTPGSGGAGSSFVQTSIYNFLPEEALSSPDEVWAEEWDQGFELLESLHPYMYQSAGKVVYPNKNQGTLDLLANFEIDMCPAWADMVISQKMQGTMPESIQLVQIDPAFTGNLCGFIAPSFGTNHEGAQAFMDYMLSPDAQNIALESMAALPVIDFSLLDQELVKNIETLNISEFRSSSIGDLGTQINERWDREIATLG